MLYIAADHWLRATRLLRRPPHDQEHVAYFDGIRFGEEGVVTTVTAPNAESKNGSYTVSAEEMSAAGKHLIRHGLRRLAQLHTHPSDWTGHSSFDDEMAYSQRDGAISIILPNYGTCAPGLRDCGIHLREPFGWRELDFEEIDRSVTIVPSQIDLRR